jgi:hypothetical protein
VLQPTTTARSETLCLVLATVGLRAGNFGWERAIESVATMAPLLMGEDAAENPFCASKTGMSDQKL